MGQRDSSGNVEHVVMTPDFGVMRSGNMCAVVWRGATTTQGIGTLESTAKQALRDYPGKVIVYGVVEETAEVPSGPMRKLSGDVNDSLAQAGVVGFAGLIPVEGFFGAWVRGVASGLSMVSRKRYPFKIFANALDAATWFTSLTQLPLDAGRQAAELNTFRQDYADYLNRDQRIAG